MLDKVEIATLPEAETLYLRSGPPSSVAQAVEMALHKSKSWWQAK